MQAVDEPVSRQIIVTPNKLPEGENVEFQVTSARGVSFPPADKTPTIVVAFAKPAQVRSVTIPRDRPTTATVQQFQLTLYAPDGSKINAAPISSETSPTDDKKKPATVDSSRIPSGTLVSRVEITIVRTTDGEAPKGVVLDIKACTEPSTGQYF
jgi:hypothetical protein